MKGIYLSKVRVVILLPCLAFVLCHILPAHCEDTSEKAEQSAVPKKKKPLSAYTDADMERIFEQWEKDEEDLPDDELPEHLRKGLPMDFSQLDQSDPEAILKMTKKGKSLMMFVTVSENPDKNEFERITSLWHSGLFNMHIETQKFPVDDNRVIFMFKDGSQAWEAKDFLIEQERCSEVVIESKSYPGKRIKKTADVKKQEL